jgi:hypothetical protein
MKPVQEITTRIFKYFVPEINKEIKVERVHNKTYVADIGEGPERIPLWQMKADKWECRGKWEDENEKMY